MPACRRPAVVSGKLAGVVAGMDALTPAASWAAMQHAVRNLGKPGGMDIAASEYGYHLPYFQQMLDAGAVDCLQADVTRHLEYFHDHVRIERIAFDGALEPEGGSVLRPDRSRPGLGLDVKHADLEQYRVGGGR